MQDLKNAIKVNCVLCNLWILWMPQKTYTRHWKNHNSCYKKVHSVRIILNILIIWIDLETALTTASSGVSPSWIWRSVRKLRINEFEYCWSNTWLLMIYLDLNSVNLFLSIRLILFAGGYCVVVFKCLSPGINLKLLLGQLVWYLLCATVHWHCSSIKLTVYHSINNSVNSVLLRVHTQACLERLTGVILILQDLCSPARNSTIDRCTWIIINHTSGS